MVQIGSKLETTAQSAQAVQGRERVGVIPTTHVDTHRHSWEQLDITEQQKNEQDL